MSTQLNDLAIKLLRDHGNPDAATKPLVNAVKKDDTLLHALALVYLIEIDAKTTQTSRQRTGPHRRPKSRRVVPTDAQRKASLAVVAKVSASILDTRKLRDGRRIGDVRVLELSRLADLSAFNAADFLRRGFRDAVDAFACKLMSEHVVPTGPDVKVRDVLKAKDVERIYLLAEPLAAKRIAEEAKRVAQNILKKKDDDDDKAA